MMFGGGGESSEDKQSRVDAAKMTLERADAQARETEARRQKEEGALQQVTAQYVEATKRLFNKRVEIARLRVHIKLILHYMRAIWLSELAVSAISGSTISRPHGSRNSPRWKPPL